MAPMKLIGHLTPRTRRDMLEDWQIQERIFVSIISSYVISIVEIYIYLVYI